MSVQLVVWGPESGLNVPWILWSGKTKSFALQIEEALCGHVPLHLGLMGELCIFPCGLVRFPDKIG